MILASAALCMALNIYMEARGESLMGQIAVAEVTMNRADHNPQNVCKVVVKSDQFSWTKHRLYEHRHHYYLRHKYLPREKAAWKLAQAVAYFTLKGLTPDPTHGARFYHANYVNPRWDNDMRLVTVIGRHEFYAMR